jgi:hypothetical protein
MDPGAPARGGLQPAPFVTQVHSRTVAKKVGIKRSSEQDVAVCSIRVYPAALVRFVSLEGGPSMALEWLVGRPVARAGGWSEMLA